MVSRDTIVQIVVVIVAIALLVVTASVGVATDGVQSTALFVLFYGLVLGGAHLYLAIRGEDGIVPVESRWRYVTALAVVLIAVVMISYGGDRTVAGVPLESVGLALLVVTVLAYLLVESVAGYRSSRREES